MKFHDSRGMLEEWRKYWEARGGVFSTGEARALEGPLNSQQVSGLLYLQWAKARGEVEESPLDDYGEELVRVVEQEPERTPGEYMRLIESLSRPIEHVSIRLWSPWERMAVGKWARIEEFLERQSKRRLRERVRRKKSTRLHMNRVGKEKRRGGIRYKSPEELEELAIRAEGQSDGMARMRAAKYWNQAELRRREILMAKKTNVVAEEPGKAVGERPEVEMEVIRVGPNPRVVVCRYKVLADERIIKLKVKSNVKFVRGMRVKMREQEGVEWEYNGTLPRRKGVW